MNRTNPESLFNGHARAHEGGTASKGSMGSRVQRGEALVADVERLLADFDAGDVTAGQFLSAFARLGKRALQVLAMPKDEERR